MISSNYEKKFTDLINNELVSVSESFARKIFFNWQNIEIDKIIFTKESIYSSSRSRGSKRLIEIIKNHIVDTDITITDATANIGTDTINLSSVFSKINAIEISELNYYALQNNIKLFNCDDKVTTYLGDSNLVIKKLKQDIIYVDAPWGGPEYKQTDNIKLYLGNVEIFDFYLENIDRATMFIFKVPINYDFDYLKNKVKNEIHKYTYKKGDIIKYYLLILLK